MTDEIQAVIDRIIAEHKVLLQGLESVDKVANDAQALYAIDKAKGSFMPGSIQSKHGLKDFTELFDKVDQGLRSHFSFEETALFDVIQKHGSRDLTGLLHRLLLEHHDLRDRLTKSRDEIDKLVKGNLDRQSWEASAYDMRAHLTHTRKLVEVHAELEQEMLRDLKKKIEGSKGQG